MTIDGLVRGCTRFRQDPIRILIALLISASRKAYTKGFKALLLYCRHLMQAPIRPISTRAKLQGKQYVNTNAPTKWGSQVMKNTPLITNSVEAVFISRRIFLLSFALVTFASPAGSTLLWIKDLVILKMRAFTREMTNSAKRNTVERVYSGKFLLMRGVSAKWRQESKMDKTQTTPRVKW